MLAKARQATVGPLATNEVLNTKAQLVPFQPRTTCCGNGCSAEKVKGFGARIRYGAPGKHPMARPLIWKLVI